jgi:hypothetical protein
MTTRPKSDSGETAEIARPTTTDIAGKPKLIIATGRGKVGKSTLARWAIERAVDQGSSPVILDADRTNPTLKAFFPDAIQPSSVADWEVREWLNTAVDAQIEHETPCAFLDLGGGDLTLKQWAADLDLAQFLPANGVIPVLFHLLSSDLDDLVYMRDLEAVFAPPHTAIVLNEGTLAIGRDPAVAFEQTLSHPILRAAADRGVRVLSMPRLGCMQDIDRRRLSFQAAQAGIGKPGQDKLGPTRRQMIAMWRRQMDANFAPVASWIN